jgi:hypothetical protein
MSKSTHQELQNTLLPQKLCYDWYEENRPLSEELIFLDPSIFSRCASLCHLTPYWAHLRWPVVWQLNVCTNFLSVISLYLPMTRKKVTTPSLYVLLSAIAMGQTTSTRSRKRSDKGLSQYTALNFTTHLFDLIQPLFGPFSKVYY